MEWQYKKSKQPQVSPKNCELQNNTDHDNDSEEEECWNELNEIECNDQDTSVEKYYNICDNICAAQKINFDPQAKSSSGGESSVDDQFNDDIEGTVLDETFEDSQSLDVPNGHDIDC